MKNMAFLSCDTSVLDQTVRHFVRIGDMTSPLIFMDVINIKSLQKDVSAQGNFSAAELQLP